MLLSNATPIHLIKNKINLLDAELLIEVPSKTLKYLDFISFSLAMAPSLLSVTPYNFICISFSCSNLFLNLVPPPPRRQGCHEGILDLPLP